MKKIFAITLLFALTVTLVSPISIHAQRKTSASRTAATPEQVARQFYSWYVGALNRNMNARPLQKQRTTAKKYLSARLYKEITDRMNSPEGIDADYFLDAQDWDEDWARKITATKVKQEGNDATVDVVLDGKLMPKHRLQLTLKREAGAWKIDTVTGSQA